jgi:hypothetical protein
MDKRNEQLSNNIYDLIDPSDKIKIDEYLPFLRCYKCMDVMIEPKSCSTCNLNLCPKCHKQTCSHQLTQSRHLKSILEGLTFKCKNKGCTKSLKYHEIRPHLLTCPNGVMGDYNRDNTNVISKSTIVLPDKKDSAVDINDNLSKSLIYNNAIDSQIQPSCKSCGETFIDRSKYLEHMKICKKGVDFVKPDIVETFKEKLNNLQNTFGMYHMEKLKESTMLSHKLLQEKISVIEGKFINISNYENLLGKINNDEDMNSDPEIINIKQQEETIKKQKEALQKDYQDMVNEYQEKLMEYESAFNEEIKQYKEKLAVLEVEEKWLKEDMDSSVFITDSGVCNICGNNDTSVKKFFCQDCSSKYCVNKCAKMCKNPNCTKTNKYICPKDSRACNLCRKFNYCEECKKRCFYQNCQNSFCPECYKKNEHQARNSNINCKFFTCERDQICDCLMTSIYCSKCEKRLCNKCLMSDIDHHPFLI